MTATAAQIQHKNLPAAAAKTVHENMTSATDQIQHGEHINCKCLI